MRARAAGSGSMAAPENPLESSRNCLDQSSETRLDGPRLVNASGEHRRSSAMKTNGHETDATLAGLGRMTVGQLRDKYLAMFGEPTRSGNRDFLFKRLAWRIQS